MNHKLSRRQFLQSSALFSSSLAFSPVVWAQSKPLDINSLTASGQPAFKGFIVSDAHFGWRGDAQPTPSEQQEMMKRILKRFPDLDVFLDTGDAHHNYARPEDKEAWTKVIADGCGKLPFYYVPGNHEMDAWGYKHDPEWLAMRMGSLGCRPYYSFDMKGIHVISLPQMINMSYVSSEALEWVKLDLELNKDKNVIILSHNSLAGTTKYFGDIGYRQTSNSAMVLEVIHQYPNILAWMHGHNHTYEVVLVGGTMYVSNGRIGGFNPGHPGNYGKDNLGGVYFEVTPDTFKVMCYSATQDKFFHEIEGHGHLTHILKRKTSLDPAALPAVSYGYGCGRDGQIVPVYRYHAGGEEKLYYTAAPTQDINENPDFSVYTQRTSTGWHTKHLAGYNLEPLEENEIKEDNTWEWMDPGVKILARGDAGEHKDLVCPGGAVGHRGYYRVPPGRKYTAQIHLNVQNPAPHLQFICYVVDRNLKRQATLQSDVYYPAPGRQILEHTFDVPKVEDTTIYSDTESDNAIHIAVAVRFTHLLSDVLAERFRLFFADAVRNDAANHPAMILDEKGYSKYGVLEYGQIAEFDLAKRQDRRMIAQVKADGNRQLTWLVQQTGPQWQVRNAPASWDGQTLRVGPIRNPFNREKEIVLVPLRKTGAMYVHRLYNVDIARIVTDEKNKTVTVVVEKSLGQGWIELAAAKEPKKVTNAVSWHFEEGRLMVETPGETTVTIEA